MATHNSTQVPLKDYLKSVHEFKTLIPEFQRDFVWLESNMIKLVSSLLKGYPIGSFLLMQNNQQYASRPVKGILNQTPIQDKDSLLVLDGQQRTTSAYQIFYGTGEYKFYLNYKEFALKLKNKGIENADGIIDEFLEDLICAVTNNSKNEYVTSSQQIASGYFPLDLIINDKPIIDYNKWLDDYALHYASLGGSFNPTSFQEASNYKSVFINKLITNIISYQASQIIISGNTSANIICTIFETINSTGVKLTVLDLLNAKCFPIKFILRNAVIDTFEKYHLFSDFDKDNGDDLIGLSLVKIIALITRNSCKRSVLLDLKPETIRDNWTVAVENLYNALRYMKENFGILGLRYLPYKDVVPVIALIINSPKFDLLIPEHRSKLNKWYWHCVFSNYFDNATEAKSVQTINEFIGSDKLQGWLENDGSIPLLIKNSDIYNSDFNKLDNASSQSALYKAILNLIVLNGASDFSKDKALLSTLSETDLQDHHIYPKKPLSGFKIKGQDANTIFNRTLISSFANQSIKDNHPNVYFHDTNILETKFNAADLSKHFIDIKFTDKQFAVGSFTEENYYKFIHDRKSRIVQFIKELLR